MITKLIHIKEKKMTKCYRVANCSLYAGHMQGDCREEF